MAENNGALALAILGLGKGVSKAYVDGEIAVLDEKIENLPHGMQYKGVVLYYDLLPTVNVEIGDMYTIKYQGTSEEAGTAT